METNKKPENVPEQLSFLGDHFSSIDSLSFENKVLISILALSTIKGIGFRTICDLADGNLIDQLWHANLADLETLLARFPIKNRTTFVKSIFDNRALLLETGFRKAEQLTNQGIRFIPKGHPHYPSCFLKLKPPPKWIFAKGDIDALLSPGIVGVIGTRDATLDGIQFAKACARELVQQNITVLSGLAKGIDESAHQGAVDYYGQSIGVLGHGINSQFASINLELWERVLERNGLIISEYLPEDSPSRENFLRRNELQAVLSKVVIPVECPSLTSGTGATIRRAISFGTPVVGIFQETVDSQSLELTKTNLIGLGLPVFSSPSETQDFWMHLRRIMPDHNWDAGPNARQERLIKTLEEKLIREMLHASFDAKAVDRLARMIKMSLRKQSREER